MKKIRIIKDRFKCQECGKIYFSGEFLRAKNPFDDSDEISGCPNCKSINCFYGVCDFELCKRDSTCGTPTNSEFGYIRHCGGHREEVEELTKQ